MSIGQTIANIFGGNSQQNQPTPGNIPTNSGMPANPLPNTAVNGTVPEVKNLEEKKESTPLEEFKDLWKNDPIDPKAQTKDNRVFGDINKDELMKAASSINFTDVITPEMLQAIQAGGEAGTAALIQALNKTQQLTYAQSTHAATILVEKGIEKARSQFQTELPSHIRNVSASESFKASNHLANNPAAQPLIQGVMSQLQVKFPNASPSELSSMANQYLEQFANSVLEPQRQKQQQQTQSQQMDWEAWSARDNN